MKRWAAKENELKAHLDVSTEDTHLFPRLLGTRYEQVSACPIRRPSSQGIRTCHHDCSATLHFSLFWTSVHPSKCLLTWSGEVSTHLNSNPFVPHRLYSRVLAASKYHYTHAGCIRAATSEVEDAAASQPAMFHSLCTLR